MRLTPFRAAVAAFLTLTAPACRKDAEPAPPSAPRPQVIHLIPTPAGSTLRDTTGTEDAERRTYRVAMSVDSVRAFYRPRLPSLGWAIMSDQGDTATVDIYASRPNQSFWLQVRRLQPFLSEFTLLVRVGADLPARDGVR
jgi:hypothetical protein